MCLILWSPPQFMLFSNLWDWSCFLQGIFSPGEGNGHPLQYSCLENRMDGWAQQATVHGVKKSWTRLSDITFKFLIFDTFQALHHRPSTPPDYMYSFGHKYLWFHLTLAFTGDSPWCIFSSELILTVTLHLQRLSSSSSPSDQRRFLHSLL